MSVSAIVAVFAVKWGLIMTLPQIWAMTRLSVSECPQNPWEGPKVLFNSMDSLPNGSFLMLATPVMFG